MVNNNIKIEIKNWYWIKITNRKIELKIFDRLLYLIENRYKNEIYITW